MLLATRNRWQHSPNHWRANLLPQQPKRKKIPHQEVDSPVEPPKRKRNDLYVQMDVERDALNELIAKKQGVGATKESAAAKLKEIREKYMDKIRDLRGKITVVRR